MKYAIVDIAGKQYKVEEGQELAVDKLATKEGKITFDRVFLVVNQDEVMFGNPTVSSTKIEAEILGEEKGEKIRVVKYKAKSRYRKTRGFRPLYTRVKVTKICS